MQVLQQLQQNQNAESEEFVFLSNTFFVSFPAGLLQMKKQIKLRTVWLNV